MSRPLSSHEWQLRTYWRILSAGIGGEQSLSEYQDELDLLAKHAVSPSLRAMCIRSLHRFDHLGSMRRVAAR